MTSVPADRRLPGVGRGAGLTPLVRQLESWGLAAASRSSGSFRGRHEAIAFGRHLAGGGSGASLDRRHSTVNL